MYFYPSIELSAMCHNKEPQSWDKPSESPIARTNGTMKRFLVVFCLLGSFVNKAALCNVSDFHLKGDFLIGGLFNIHHVSTPANQGRPEVIDCST